MPKRHHTLDKEKRRQAREIQPVVELWQMATGSFLTQAIYVAARLHIADHLADGPMTVEELAKVSGSNAQSLYRLMRMLASVGIFTEIRDGQFQLTQLSQPMRSNVPSSIAEGLRLLGRPFYWDSWGALKPLGGPVEPALRIFKGLPSLTYYSGIPGTSAASSGWRGE
ncbi:MAG: helix-turn-helix transcriptional regulator, partial [Nitrospirae bacterium]|nr:helix-turn-helix transcriptional regulator [Nitrospirota bacterium]